MKEVIGEVDFCIEIPMPYAETIDEKVINKKVEDALAHLKNRNFSAAYSLVADIDPTHLAAQRVKFLSVYGVSSERELSYSADYIEINAEYQNLLQNGSPDLIKAYTRLAETIKQNQEVYAEIIEVNKLLEVKLWDDAIEYATKMTEKYPDCCLAWARLLAAKQNKVGREYGYDTDRALFEETKKLMERMLACPDIEYYGQATGKYCWGVERYQSKDGNSDNYVRSQILRYESYVKNEEYCKKKIEDAKKAAKKAEEDAKENKKATIMWILIGVGVFAFMILTKVFIKI